MSSKNYLASSVGFSIALDESTDIEDNHHLAVFLCYVSKYFCVKDDLLDLVAIMDTTKGVDVKNAIDAVLSECVVKLVSGATDRPPGMFGKLACFSYPEFLPIHCVIYHEHLAAKYFKYDHVMKTVLDIVSFIRSSAMTLRQFRYFCRGGYYFKRCELLLHC